MRTIRALLTGLLFLMAVSWTMSMPQLLTVSGDRQRRCTVEAPYNKCEKDNEQRCSDGQCREVFFDKGDGKPEDSQNA